MLPMLKLWPRARTDDRWWLTALAVGLLIPSVVLNVVSGALYPHYPETFDNPVFDLAFPLIGEGYAPYGLGWLLHLPGRWALAPVGLIVAAALALVASGQDPRPRRMAAHLAVGVAVAGAFLIGLGAYGRTPRAAEARSASLVRQAWDPPRR
jgi:peptidoglycan/LPS O-acetylase OafA/YrhL